MANEKKASTTKKESAKASAAKVEAKASAAKASAGKAAGGEKPAGKASTQTTAAKKAERASAVASAKAVAEAKPAKAAATGKTTAKAEPAKKAASASKKVAAGKAGAASRTLAAGKADTAKAEPVKAAASAKKTATAKTPTAKASAAKAGATGKTAAATKAASKVAGAKASEPAASTSKAAKGADAKKPAAKKGVGAPKAEPKVEPAKKAASASKAEPATKAASKAAASKKAEPLKKAAAAKKARVAKKDEVEKPARPAAAKAPEANEEVPAKAERALESAPEPEHAPASDSGKTPAPAPEPAAEPAPAPEPAAGPAPEPAPESAAEPAPAPAPEPAAEPAPEALQGEFAEIGGVLIAAAECAPFVKVGGLADVVGSLPKYLKKLGVEGRIIMPFHRQVKERFGAQTEHMADFQASLGWRSQYVGLEKLVVDDVTYYFIDNEFYFGGPIYCGGEFEGEQYAFFTRAVMDAMPLLDFDVRVLHCNDWHTAMMPLLAKTQYQGGMQAGLKTLLTIHNLHYQGQFSHEFDRDLLGVDDFLATPQFIEHYGCDNMLKAGIVFADKVNTVSPTYAREICEPYLGESLDGVLRSRGADLSGILNGIDDEMWNPATDARIPVNFTAETIERKAQVKDALLDELGLMRAPEGEEVPLIGMVSRLVPQKGVDLLKAALDGIMAENVRVVVLGSGFQGYEDYLRDAEMRHKGRLCSYIGYNADLAHRIYAGSDLFLVPSLFEPCGITQMISMRYGTLPVVRETGGLRDTVAPYNEYTGEGNGFSFANYDAGEMLGVIRYALSVWRDPGARERLVKQAMASDFGFERCARSYAELYRAL